MIRTFAAALATTTCMVALATPAAAQTREYNIPAGSLKSALDAYVRQSGRQVIYRADEVRSARSPGVRGQHSPEAALNRILTGTGFTTRIDGSLVAIIRLGNGQSVAGREASLGAQRALSEGAAESQEGVADIVVVGSRLGSSESESAQPVKIITREFIDRSGASSVSEVLNTLPEVSLNASGAAAQSIAGTTQVQLRGLPVGTTLVLINGRRIATSGLDTRSGAFNLGTIPLNAVERIEVLPSGSSAVYGGDALGGVVNVVLRDDLSGFSATARYGASDGYDESQVSLAWGHTWSNGSVSMIANHSRNSRLSGSERELTSDEDYRRFGGPDLRSLNGNPGTVYSLNGQNLPGLPSSFAAVPAGSTGVGLTPADLVGTAGVENRSSNGALSATFHPSESSGIFLSGTYDLTQSIELFAELFYSTIETNTLSSPHTLNRNVPATNPFNPFNTTVRVRYRLDGIGGPETEHTERYLRPLVGARGDIGAWSWELAGWMSDSHLERLTKRRALDLVAVDAALASSNPNTALNVFRDGPAASADVLASLFVPDELIEFETGLRSANGILRGPLLDLPAGPLNMLIGAEYERSFLDFAPGTASAVNADRNSYAVFGEFRLPLWGRSTNRGMLQVLSVTGAVRYDHYDDFGSRVSPSVGVELRPMQSLLLRASYAEAFKPPVLHQLFAPLTSSPSTVTDPQLGERYTVSNVLIGGNSSLSPQTGRAYTIGFVFVPTSVPDLRLSLTYWSNRLESGFTQPTPQYIVDNVGLFPGRVVRDGAGRITQIDTSWINFGYIDQAGFDLSASWRTRTGIGNFTPAVSLTHTAKYETQAIVNAPPEDGVSRANSNGFAPRWKGNVSLAWNHNNLSATMTGRYVGAYRDYRPLTDGSFQTLGDRWWIDFNAQYELDRGILGSSRATIIVGAVNLLDAEPQYSTFLSYDPRIDDIRGRFIYAQLRLEL